MLWSQNELASRDEVFFPTRFIQTTLFLLIPLLFSDAQYIVVDKIIPQLNCSIDEENPASSSKSSLM